MGAWLAGGGTSPLFAHSQFTDRTSVRHENSKPRFMTQFVLDVLFPERPDARQHSASSSCLQAAVCRFTLLCKEKKQPEIMQKSCAQASKNVKSAGRGQSFKLQLHTVCRIRDFSVRRRNKSLNIRLLHNLSPHLYCNIIKLHPYVTRVSGKCHFRN